MDELRGVNLSKFVSEAVAAICDAKLKSSDIQAAVQVIITYRMCTLFFRYLFMNLFSFNQVCSLLHQRYKDFSLTLVQGLTKTFFPGKSAEDVDADRNLKAMKKRSALKLLLELFFDGVIEDTGILITIIKDLASLEHLKDRDLAHTNLSLLASFARQARYFIGLPHAGEELVEEVFSLSIMGIFIIV